MLLDVNNEAQVTVAFPANGKYTLEADVTVPRHSSADKPGAPAHGYGVFRYSARVNVSAQPKVEFSSTRVEQGAVITVLLTGLSGRAGAIRRNRSQPGPILRRAWRKGRVHRCALQPGARRLYRARNDAAAST